MFATQQQQPQPRGDQQSWDLQAPAFSADAANASGTPRDRWPPTSEESRWGGSGRGRGRGRPVDGIRQFKSRIPCSFYAQGRQAHIPTPSSFRLCLNERTNGNPVKTDASTAISATSATIRVLARTARGV
jgi:hypothetical protein